MCSVLKITSFLYLPLFFMNIEITSAALSYLTHSSFLCIVTCIPLPVCESQICNLDEMPVQAKIVPQS